MCGGRQNKCTLLLQTNADTHMRVVAINEMNAVDVRCWTDGRNSFSIHCRKLADSIHPLSETEQLHAPSWSILNPLAPHVFTHIHMVASEYHLHTQQLYKTVIYSQPLPPIVSSISQSPQPRFARIFFLLQYKKPFLCSSKGGISTPQRVSFNPCNLLENTFNPFEPFIHYLWRSSTDSMHG